MAARRKEGNFLVRRVSAKDLPQMVEIHFRCFGSEEHVATLLGRRFISRMYRWFAHSSRAVSVCCEVDGRIVGFATASDGPYHRLVLKENKVQALLAILARPWLFFKPVLWKRLWHLASGTGELEQWIASQARAAYCGLIAVEPEWRKAGVACAMNTLLFEEAVKRGWASLVAIIYADNAASREMTAKLGFEEILLPAELGRKVVMVKRLI